MVPNASSRPHAVKISGLKKFYVEPTTGTALRVLDNVTLTVGEGEFVSLIGPSGCGKTTLLKIVDGLMPFDAGEVFVRGRSVEGPGPDRALVFQSFALLPWLTVRENVGFGLQLQGVERRIIAERTRHFVDMVGLRGFEDFRPGQLSGGMQQRVGLARALAVNPEILLMDEPFGSLDAQTRNLLQADLERIWEADHKTVVFVTHAMDEAVFLSDRVVIMGTRPGHIHEVIGIDLPRPRGDATRKDPEFVRLTAYVWDVLRSLLLPDDTRGAQG